MATCIPRGWARAKTLSKQLIVALAPEYSLCLLPIIADTSFCNPPRHLDGPCRHLPIVEFKMQSGNWIISRTRCEAVYADQSILLSASVHVQMLPFASALAFPDRRMLGDSVRYDGHGSRSELYQPPLHIPLAQVVLRNTLPR
ncbi:hypothetical protein BKA58DRAFT_376929 [Alternaria rosae]|uniref:uncharacterized protein n=1 Tax=Alternaria rosae TaxID=1187941 RepID=UPI001E8CB8C2|nr:uncharacterized protein BKA58DRAFT_376929 [Alternaria rosae]KAH6878312.1 hypothetical protein BKA58DRAFT_376929 [Alternaria rosae]